MGTTLFGPAASQCAAIHYQPLRPTGDLGDLLDLPAEFLQGGQLIHLYTLPSAIPFSLWPFLSPSRLRIHRSAQMRSPPRAGSPPRAQRSHCCHSDADEPWSLHKLNKKLKLIMSCISLFLALLTLYIYIYICVCS